jgi:hypothetical protein
MSTKKALKEQSSMVEKHTDKSKDTVKDTVWTEENQKLLEAGYIMSKTGELYTWKPNNDTKIEKR